MAEQQPLFLVQPLKDLFINRLDCYCVQLKQGYTRIEEPLTDAILESHLKGEKTVGAYQLDSENRVKWLAFDLDPEKLRFPQATAKQILNVLFEKKANVDGKEKPRVRPQSVILEASRYPDPSFHVWILFLVPVKAKVARWLGLRILEMANLTPQQVEVFPKQAELTQDRPYGNFVKLPFGKHQVENKWSRPLDVETFEPLPYSSILDIFGASLSEADLSEIESFETKKHVQTAFKLPKTFKPLSDREEEKAVKFLCKYWREGYRNQLAMFFVGLCLKKGVSYESARHIIEEVADRANDEEKQTRLELVNYHYRNRLNCNLKGASGIREIIEEMH